MTIRSFFALPLPIGAEQVLVRACEPLRRRLMSGLNAGASIHWIPPENYHLTLAFLGEIEPRAIHRLHDIARQLSAASKPARFSLSRIEWFPSSVKPRLLVATPTEDEPLRQFQKQLARMLNQNGFHLEKRPFRPHVSLARLQSIASPFDLTDESLHIRCDLDELVLFSSVQRQGDSVYSPLFVEPVGAYP